MATTSDVGPAAAAAEATPAVAALGQAVPASDAASAAAAGYGVTTDPGPLAAAPKGEGRAVFAETLDELTLRAQWGDR